GRGPGLAEERPRQPGWAGPPVDVGDEKCVHLRVFRSLPHETKPLTLHAYQTNKAKHDELTYF
uniref:Uncharacterized protein n=1 Tax=Spermophilus dauricus TaxID=99837 RepID=A0A8C9USG4_SPEDA